MERDKRHSQMGLHGSVRADMSMEANRRAWETRGEPRFTETKKFEVPVQRVFRMEAARLS